MRSGQLIPFMPMCVLCATPCGRDVSVMRVSSAPTGILTLSLTAPEDMDEQPHTYSVISKAD
jgi:hypothetical protein